MNLLIAFLLLLPFQTETGSTTNHSVQIESTIDKVTVYRDGALVHRSSEVQLPAGTSQLVFTGLTRQIHEETITLRTEQESLTLLSLNTRLNREGSAQKREKIDSLTIIKQNLEDEITLLNADQTNLTRELDLLAANQSLTGGQGVELSGLKEAMEYYRERYRTIESRKIESDKELSRVRENLNEINRKINELENEIRRQSNEVVAVINSPGEQAAILELSYVSYRAGWTPSYDVRYSGTNSPLILDYKAEIYQDTGEDWNRVSLAISSGQHQRGNTVPDISTEYVDFQQEDRALDMGAQLRLREEVVVTAAPVPPTPGEAVRIDEQIRFSYAIQEPHSIPSGDRAVLPFHREETAVDVHHITVPKLNSGAFLVAEIKDWESLHLIDGEANLFMYGSFTGKSRITTGVFEESLRLSLGQNDFILAERNRFREVTSRNFFGNRTRENHGWEIVLRNTGNEPVSVTVKDQIPVSRLSEISVELTERSGATFNENRGILEWEVDLQPGQTHTIPFSYRIEFPRDRQIRRF
jgi:uncharacterized protein (TIGR02231 family)